MEFDDIGPLQVLVVGFDADTEFSGTILDELERLMTRGTIRVIDLRFLTRLGDETVAELELSGLEGDEAEAYGTVIDRLRELAGQDVEGDGDSGGIGPAQIERIADELDVGESVGILLFEHTWATELKTAIRGTGGRLVTQGFLTPEAALMVGAEVAAIAEAEATIELADAIAGAAMLDAAAAVAAADDIATAAAVDAVRALIAAGIVVDAAAATALEALVDAELVTEMAFEAAALAVDETAAEVERAMEELAAVDSTDA